MKGLKTPRGHTSPKKTTTETLNTKGIGTNTIENKHGLFNAWHWQAIFFYIFKHFKKISNMKKLFFASLFLLPYICFSQATITGHKTILLRQVCELTEGVYFNEYASDSCTYYTVSAFIPYSKDADHLPIATLCAYDDDKFYPDAKAVIVLHNVRVEGLDGQIYIYKTPQSNRMTMDENDVLGTVSDGAVIQLFQISR